MFEYNSKNVSREITINYIKYYILQLQDKENIAFSHIEQFDDIRDASKKNEKLPYSVPLKDLLPSNTASFFRYEGSLTDARCNEDVIWTVFETPIHISHNQVFCFADWYK
jgi:carbonic anhydrase